MKDKVFVGGYIPAEMSEEIQKYLTEEDVTFSQFLRKALKNFLRSNLAERKKTKINARGE